MGKPAFFSRRRSSRGNVRGGDPSCVHHYLMERPRWVEGSHYFYERGVCKKCGAVTEFLRSEHPEFEDSIVLTTELQEEVLSDVGYENDMGEPD